MERAKWIVGLLLASMLLPLHAEVKSKVVEYRDGEEVLQGYLYWDDTVQGKRPGVMVVHEWWGLNDYARKRAAMIAELGYVAFAVDMYGKGMVTDKPEQAQEWMQAITADVELWRERAQMGIDILRKHPRVDANRIAAIGYCFGGGTVLQLAYGGAKLDGVVSFHGSLPVAPEEAKGKVAAPILLLHGYNDGFVKPDVVANFQAKLDAAGAQWEMDSYGGVRHSFTNRNAAKYGIPNLRYDARADRRSWQRMQQFFDEIFAKGRDGA